MSIPSIDAAGREADASWEPPDADGAARRIFEARRDHFDALVMTWRHWPAALFYVCKAMGPPRHIAWRGDVGDYYPIAARDPVESASWWEWFDAARAWVEGIS